MPKLTLPASIGLTLALMALFHLLSIPQMLGAHPWFVPKVILIGTPIGLLIGALFRYSYRSYKFRVIATFVALIGVYFVTKSSGEQFAASFAEDKIAGRFWYFGWMGTSATLSAFFFTILSR